MTSAKNETIEQGEILRAARAEFLAKREKKKVDGKNLIRNPALDHEYERALIDYCNAQDEWERCMENWLSHGGG